MSSGEAVYCARGDLETGVVVLGNGSGSSGTGCSMISMVAYLVQGANCNPGFSIARRERHDYQFSFRVNCVQPLTRSVKS